MVFLQLAPSMQVEIIGINNSSKQELGIQLQIILLIPFDDLTAWRAQSH